MRIFFSLVGVLILLLAGAWGFVEYKRPVWEASAQQVIEQAKQAQDDPQKWEDLAEYVEKSFPQRYPLTLVSSVFSDVADLMQQVKSPPTFQFDFEQKQIPAKTIESFLTYGQDIKTRVRNLYQKLDTVPLWLMTSKQRSAFMTYFDQLVQAVDYINYIDDFDRVYQELKANQGRFVVLLQNNNEVRSTGGFAGSLLVADVSDTGITFDISDIYSFDRLVPPEAQLSAPEFFHPLSKTLSLRDANFWPDFPTSAKTYQQFFQSTGGKTPHTVFAINLNVIQEVLAITGPITLKKWNITLDQYNFDLLLQFLVESKITGRFDPKAPVELFANSLSNKIKNTPGLATRLFTEINWPQFIQSKNLLAYSQDEGIQDFFERVNIDGMMEFQAGADNVLYFDFVSVGANKSDKFAWTKINHKSSVTTSGIVDNTLNIRRTHSLAPGQLEQILGYAAWPPNVQNLLDGELRWKLGEGENRNMLRLWLPKNSKMGFVQNVSGAITEHQSDDGRYAIWHVPLFTLMGESNEVIINYQTRLKQPGKKWNAYLLELLGTPGREKTTFTTNITTTPNGVIQTEGDGWGKSLPLTDQQFRSVIRFE